MMMMLALRCRWLGEGMEGVALGDEYRKGVFLVLQLVFTIEIR